MEGVDESQDWKQGKRETKTKLRTRWTRLDGRPDDQCAASIDKG